MSQTAKRQLSVRLFVFLGAVCTVFLLIGGAAEAEGPPPQTIEYVVAEGDSLWTIAAAYGDPGSDTRALIAEIKRTNGLGSSTIYPGQLLAIPQT